MATKIGSGSIVNMVIFIVIILAVSIPVGTIITVTTFGLGGFLMPLFMYLAMMFCSLFLTRKAFDLLPWIGVNIFWPIAWIYRIITGQMPFERKDEE